MYCRNCGHALNAHAKFCKKCGAETPTHTPPQIPGTFLQRRKGLLITSGSILAGVALLFLVFSDSGYVEGDFSEILTELKAAQSERQVPSLASKNVYPGGAADPIAETVVDIICNDGSTIGGGSGTVISSEGTILTNNHIIPLDDDGVPTVEDCLATVPNPLTGKIEDIYVVHPRPIPGVSEKYDLAFFTMDKPYVDADGKSYGTPVESYVAFEGCENERPVLGDVIRVYGYPAISAGGWYLTITDGVVSAIPNDGTIITSAKISHGNSGGLAVDGNGCFVGVPSMVNSDDSESLGIIISLEIVNEFLTEADEVLSQL